MGWQNFWFLPSGWKIDGQWWGRGDVTGGKEFPGSLVIWPAGHWLRANSQTGWFIHIWTELQNYKKKLARALGDLGASVPAWFSATEYSRRVYLHFRSTDLNQHQVSQCWRTLQKAFFLTKKFKVQSILNANTLFNVGIDHTVNVISRMGFVGFSNDLLEVGGHKSFVSVNTAHLPL